MIQMILRRLLLLIPTLIGLTLLLFVISRLLPGDPVGLAAGPNASAELIARMRAEFGFDDPLWLRYWHYLTGLLSGDWGTSVFTRRPVFQDVLTYLPATLELVFSALLIAVVIGIPLGLLTAVYRNGPLDYFIRTLALGGVAMPRFFLGLLLQLAFVAWLGWLPLSGRFPFLEIPPQSVTGFYTIDALLAGDIRAFGIAVSHLILPATAMALSPLATIMRMMRASTIEVLGQDYILNARALGLSQRLIIGKYVLKNAMSATLTVIGLYVSWLLGGTVLVETVFDWPGLGLFATQAILTQDFMPVIGVTLVIAIIYLLTMLVVDILYGVLNPKVRL
ncbi:D-ala-D-ala transporter subunit (plasmid) [Ketogulonicigenium vulgare Y25]|uniref:ABC-type dipeptide/oligopeptide/nickel transport system, permease component n=1 Tax=Ketogulonicigenium vulgare (strain WSH-001) TaxID=759362 RepID=F9YBG0_KETVW|nr:ABC transporter permease [Ketogulonicigenium vulgare]ADO44275.1 D-ala-D-ala transporter subunit [Ketogulonicigenium vulgare Y25]AEM42712.1 ABC-type dipeptide/oligopeptide/nickel transport system, permease component [Ketogulonicigenium vulgare WSH-001]ALJ82838.1 peptide ABC transporter [Ketogulonicigenium vulgare]